ncbi:MAG: GTPase domain-containing protein [Nitrospira sp.]|nr:GTPase domain-containing protein [Nitrospira sp.]
MALFNYATKEITIKIVYYGPAMSGKTTNLRYLHAILDPTKRGKLLCLATETDRTLFFDLLPIDLGRIREFSIRIQLYTVPGQVMYNATRRLVLKGADAVVFVADSQRAIREQNIENFRNMRENPIANDINPDDIPLVLQYNKRDIKNVLSIEELQTDLNPYGTYEYIESIAVDGVGVEDAFHHITKQVINDIAKKQKVSMEPFDVIRPFEEEVTVGAQAGAASYEDLLATGPINEPITYEPTELPKLEKTVFNIPKPAEELAKGIDEEALLSGKASPEAKQGASPVTAEKMEMIIKSNKEIVDTLGKVLQELKQTTLEQREANRLLRDIRKSFEKIKTKKSWFKFLSSGS